MDNIIFRNLLQELAFYYTNYNFVKSNIVLNLIKENIANEFMYNRNTGFNKIESIMYLGGILEESRLIDEYKIIKQNLIKEGENVIYDPNIQKKVNDLFRNIQSKNIRLVETNDSFGLRVIINNECCLQTAFRKCTI